MNNNKKNQDNSNVITNKDSENKNVNLNENLNIVYEDITNNNSLTSRQNENIETIILENDQPIIKTSKQIIYPMIDDLVETLHNDTLNNLIDSKCVTNLDKKTFMIFVIMYFYTYLNVGKDTSKEDIKLFLSELIRNPEKRRQCIELYQKQLQFLN